MAGKEIKTLLIDVDSTIPNLALMHISTWRKELGHTVGFNVTEPDEIYASVIFKRNAHLVDGLQYFYPDAKIDIGGGGYSLDKSLPKEVDMMMPDYSIYPDCHYDLGFTTRGCIRNCYFCVVPKKEGKFHIHQHPSEFHDPKHKKIKLLDNNILADKDWFFEVTDWILKNDMAVSFNQGLDIRLMDNDIAKRIADLSRMDYWYFAFDNMDYKDDVIKGISMLKDAGVDLRHQCVFYVYMHNDSQFDDVKDRCNILRENDTLPYIMVNRDTEYTKRMSDLKRWTRPWIFFSTDYNNYAGNIKRH